MSRSTAGSALMLVGVCLNITALWLGFRERDRRERATGRRPLPVRQTPAGKILSAAAIVALLAGLVLVLLA